MKKQIDYALFVENLTLDECIDIGGGDKAMNHLGEFLGKMCRYLVDSYPPIGYGYGGT